jgi:hypothetical protein
MFNSNSNPHIQISKKAITTNGEWENANIINLLHFVTPFLNRTFFSNFMQSPPIVCLMNLKQLFANTTKKWKSMNKCTCGTSSHQIRSKQENQSLLWMHFEDNKLISKVMWFVNIVRNQGMWMRNATRILTTQTTNWRRRNHLQ